MVCTLVVGRRKVYFGNCHIELLTWFDSVLMWCSWKIITLTTYSTQLPDGYDPDLTRNMLLEKQLIIMECALHWLITVPMNMPIQSFRRDFRACNSGMPIRGWHCSNVTGIIRLILNLVIVQMFMMIILFKYTIKLVDIHILR